MHAVAAGCGYSALVRIPDVDMNSDARTTANQRAAALRLHQIKFPFLGIIQVAIASLLISSISEQSFVAVNSNCSSINQLYFLRHSPCGSYPFTPHDIPPWLNPKLWKLKNSLTSKLIPAAWGSD